MKRNLVFSLTFLLIISSCTNKPVEEGLTAKNGMVVSAREEASKIGIEILKKGGNAFDAMIATDLALAVSHQSAGNIGGGGFMVYRKANGETGALDYREKAPLSASKDMYLDKQGNVIKGLSLAGAMAIGVPGTIAGIFEVYEKFGSLPIETIFQPAIDLANKGVVVTTKQSAKIKSHLKYFKLVNKEEILFQEEINAGDTLRFPNLANTLDRVMKKGKDEFYKGETARKLVDFIKDNNGIISLKDLELYEAVWRDPVEFEYDNLKVISMSPPSSGGVCLEQIMKMIEPYDINDLAHNSLDYIKILVEAERRSFADRSYYLGDPDFVSIPKEQLVGKEYLLERMSNFSFDSPTPSNEISYGNVEILESDETTHYSIVDQFGNAIAVTTTLNGSYGSQLYCSELGFFLNNEMDDFSSKPGSPNMFGLIGGSANKIEPQKRMLSSMTPTIVEKENKLFMTLGSPGGSRIITSVLQTILNVHEFNMSMNRAVNSARFHHQWMPDIIKIEQNSFNSKLIQELKLFGYNIDYKDPIGIVDGILVKPNGILEAGADKRGDDTAVGF
ncbi:MAG: gamma-glutamyltransferase [Flavobacteriaceae bacterium]|jgi:gamma-glutamyltranspeptidase / glutathione hydrolase|nr:gamma-glutamyltransferase [Flavobacteriaceae bacterium]MBT4112478.1 gamma-glutamyltransferase [Flavobacteriaceae bacterium]MBT4614332.1 gamma-glutamyltransferase [Flavobacteriaceae bacterium]MBT5246785.1 gamma-glutamyltransferase [Flavobacteriaceae bacterium]MBT5649970.1 gamma-glutamyltransferase [Flavobacteriaceae bacterium]